MINSLKYILCLFFLFSTAISEPLLVKPIVFVNYSSNGNDWVYDKEPITRFGAGFNFNFTKEPWTIEGQYIQLGFLGNINNELFEFSDMKSLAYLDDSKDADGYWSETVNAKVIYDLNTIQFQFGIFDRKWGYGNRAIHISNKTPSYPQIGIEWKIKENLNFLFFHGFLNSGIIDSGLTILYDNQISTRFLNISRNISAHRIEWIPTEEISIGFNETVIYGSRELDIHYLIPIAPFYPIENYLGDTDNLQMGLDIMYSMSKKQYIYIAFFMDELTPEWLFDKKNHNWFAWQFGYKHNNVLINNATLLLEYNWTDQRIYQHKYEINNFYSHGQPLGFWAGPHAEEILVQYFIPLKFNIFKIKYSFAKRGLVSQEAVVSNYNDTYNKRYSDGYEIRNYIDLKLILQSKSIKGLEYLIGGNRVIFKSTGFNESINILNTNKFSYEFGVSYNLSKS